jgi:argininosuccinate lyase
VSETQVGTQLWGGRFEGGLDPAFESFNRSLPFDQRLLQQDIEGSVHWARALTSAKVLTSKESDAIIAALQQMAVDLAQDPTPLHTSRAEDIHGFVEEGLQARVGDLARKLHTGRSRNDQVATDLKLYLKQRIPELRASVHALIRSLVELAERDAALPLPGYTHLQRAQPITAGHHALAYVEMLARDLSRIEDALQRMDTSPLGCAALAGTAWPVNREALADSLGFAGGPARNSLDAVSDRDHVLEFCFAASTIMLHLSRLAEDWIFFASQEAGLISIGDAVSTGSSLMPQKKNPDALELIRGKTGRVVGRLTGLCMTLKALPLAYDKDMQEDKEALFEAIDTTDACVRVATLCVQNARYIEDNCRAACERGFLDATDLADLLVAAGLPFRDAHERVGIAVRESLEHGCELRELPLERQSELFPELAGKDLAQELAVDAVLNRRSTTGGTSPARVRAEVSHWKAQMQLW